MSVKYSIIVPAYNAEKYVRRCVDSVLSQSFANFECLCVDDGSTDMTGKILDSYTINNARVQVFHQINGGVSRARNFGLTQAHGDWIVFLDADDYFEAEYLACVDVVLGDNPQADLLVTRRTIEDETGRSWLIPDFSQSRSYTGDVLAASLDCGERLYSLVTDKVIRKGLIEAHKLRFLEGVQSGEDMLFATQLLTYSKLVVVDAKNNGSHYFRHAGSLDTQVVTCDVLLWRLRLASAYIGLWEDCHLDGSRRVARFATTAIPHLCVQSGGQFEAFYAILSHSQDWRERVLPFLLLHCSLKSMIFATGYFMAGPLRPYLLKLAAGMGH